jgi:hypothetical protein
MEFFLDLVRDLAIVTLVLAILCAAGWVAFGRQDRENHNASKTAPPE